MKDKITAEDILSKHTGQNGIYLTHGTIRGSDALEAMEDYFQQCSGDEAIGFAEWIVTEGYSFGKNLKGPGWFSMLTERPLQTNQLLKKYRDYKIYKNG